MKKPKNFEEGMASLQTLLDQLADPSTPLDKAIKLYSDTASLIEYCTTSLQKAKLEIEAIDANLFQQKMSISGNSAITQNEEDILA